MAPKGKGRKGRKGAKGPKKRRLKSPLFSSFDIRLLQTEFLANFHKCDRDSDKLAAIPMEHLGKAMRMCGLMPSEKLINTIEERVEKQVPVLTPPVSDDEWEDDDGGEGITFTEEEMAIKAALSAGQTVGDIIKKRRQKKRRRRTGKEGEEGEDEDEEHERRKREEEEEERRKAAELQAEEERQQLLLEEEEREREEAKNRKPPKRELVWPYAKRKEEIKKVAKMRRRFKHFVKWEEFVKIMELYSPIPKLQYTGQELLWAFRTLDPKLDYELEPVWLYGAEEPMVPTDEIQNEIMQTFLEGKQERFIPKETKRFIRLADFKKESFFHYKEMIEDYCKEANYSMGVEKKKRKLKLKDT